MLYNLKWKFLESVHPSKHAPKLENENTNNTKLHQNRVKVFLL